MKAKNDDKPWLVRLLNGERTVLAKAISALENETDEASTIISGIYPYIGKALVVGFTGSPGVGKSTLVNSYIAGLCEEGLRVGVIAVDPSSPLSGGAILGDRIRMAAHEHLENVFIRSLASRCHVGGLSRATARIVDVMDAAGMDVVVIETVGAGQSEVEIAEIAHTKVVVCSPGLGDDIQAIKAGILEIADILVVNKCDLPLAAHTVRQLKSMLSLRDESPEWSTPVVSTSALEGTGVVELTEIIKNHEKMSSNKKEGYGKGKPQQRVLRLLANSAADEIKKALLQDKSEEISTICDAVLKGEMIFSDAIQRLIKGSLPCKQ
ncbi:MAG: methylmalonyl Co-A mutase-associated GTPase MeaB [Alphaproteobacteria bacterium]|nr:methylmalonyl Co-A mutase-associated GTPase MeaB [Alphaproteobacteria bacterium]